MNWKAGYLEIKAQSGFADEFLNFFQRVCLADVSACARALRKRSSIVFEDVTTDQQFVGILSTHFPILHRPGVFCGFT
jgi:hypothetical protein